MSSSINSDRWGVPVRVSAEFGILTKSLPIKYHSKKKLLYGYLGSIGQICAVNI